VPRLVFSFDGEGEPMVDFSRAVAPGGSIFVFEVSDGEPRVELAGATVLPQQLVDLA